MNLSAIDIRQKIGNILFLLLILVIMLDPTNTVLHMKDKVFVMLVAYNMVCFRPDWKYLPYIAAVFSAITIGYLVAELQQIPYSTEKILAVYKSVAPLILLLWVKYYDVLRLSVIPSVLTCLLILVLYALVVSSEQMELAIYTFFHAHNDMVMIMHRSFWGIPVFGFYYKSFVAFSFAMFHAFYHFRHERKKSRRLPYFVLSLLFFVAFLISGTRGTMLVPLFLALVMFYLDLRRAGKARFLLYPVLLFCTFVVVGLVVLLAVEKNEVSSFIKYSHLASYCHLFANHPQYLLWGQGIGTFFYSEGFHRMTEETEWSYMELLRNYGLFSLIFLYVLCAPVWNMRLMARTSDYTAGVVATYIAYLFVAGTNPLLLSSTGMVMILVAYSYVEHQLNSIELPAKAESEPVHNGVIGS